MADAVEHRIAEPDVGRGHVDPRTERAGAVGKLSGLHAFEKIQILRDRSTAKRAVHPGLVGRAAVALGFLRAEVADVRLALPDEHQGVFIDLAEIVARVEGLDGEGGRCLLYTSDAADE